MNSVRVLVADDHKLVLAGIRALLEDIDGVVVVAQAGNGRDAVALAKSTSPDVILMDISMEDLNGIEATARIRADNPGARVLILSMHTTEEFVRRAFKAGAVGYLVKDSAPLELKLAIEALMRGEHYVSSRVSHHLVASVLPGRAAHHDSAIDSLTPRQREILQLIAEGKSTKNMAFRLSLSTKTIETHRSALMKRLQIRDVAGLVLFAARNGLVDLDRAVD